jgi:hypothetical protein
MHPRLGFRHARPQSWFPFSLHVNVNGREWLARQMDQAGLGYVRGGNCLVGIEDFRQAQALLDGQLRADWPGLLEIFAAAEDLDG